MRRRFKFATVWLALCAFATAERVSAQELGISSPVQAQHSWLDKDLLAQARKEGSVVVYSSMNEGEALPLWKTFEKVTGVKVNYVRGSDTQLLARILLEARARQASWDIVDTTAVSKLPPEFLAQVDPAEAKNLIPEARDPDRRWYGTYANYNAPAYNTQHVKAADLPTTYDGFLKHKEWAGHVAINETDDEWLSSIFSYYGEDRGRQLIKNLVSTLKPALTDGHLALARAVGAGEYWIALNNFVNLTINMKLSGAPTDYWGLDPLTVVFGENGINARAPHPKAALLATNFILSKEGQSLLTRAGRIPVRKDVPTNPADAVSKLGDRKIVVVNFSADQDKKWAKTYQELFHSR